LINNNNLNPDDYPMASVSPTKLGPSPRPSQLDEKQQFRAKRLIIKTSMEFLDKLDSMKLRDHINDSFYQNGYPELAVQDIWDKFIPYTSIHQDLAWTKLMSTESLLGLS
jgi:hypothetical protein